MKIKIEFLLGGVPVHSLGLFRMYWGTVFISPSPRGEEILRRIEIVIRTCLGAAPRRGELPDNGSDESICSQVWKQPPEGASFQTMDSSDIGMTSLNFPYSHGTQCHDTPGWQITTVI